MDSTEGKEPDSGSGIPDKGDSAPTDEDFVGLTEAEGAALAAERKLTHRIVSVDGQPRPATRDYRPDRVNFEIEEGRITKLSRG